MTRPKNPAAPTKPRRELTVKTKKLVANVLKGQGKRKAAINAGFSKKCASEIAYETLNKPQVKEYMASAAEKLGIDPEYVLGNFKKVIEVGSVTYTKTVGQGENVAVVTEMVDSAGVLKSNEMLGKHLKLFVDKIEVDTKATVTINDSEEKKLLAKKLFLALQNPDLLGSIDLL